ncbi:MAG: hypothetical protein CK529_14090, partial [Rhodospirillaceae bacterium]
SPWQNGYAERIIGSIRRERLDHTIIFGEAHLRRTLRSYANYYNRARRREAEHPGRRRWGEVPGWGSETATSSRKFSGGDANRIRHVSWGLVGVSTLCSFEYSADDGCGT